MHATRLLKHYSVIERLRNPVVTETNVQHLLDRIKTPTNTVVGMAVNHTENNLIGDWMGAMSYLSRTMAKVFPEKDRNKLHKARRASEVDSGRGRGGRRRERGRGRGRGRGRDGGCENGQQRGLYHAKNGKTFYNGVDVSDPTRNFSGSEKMKLDREAWNCIRNRMPGGRYYEGPDNRGRGRGGRFGRGNGRGHGRRGDNYDRSVNAAGRNAEDGDQPDEQQRAVNGAGHDNKGGRMGARMGRGLYNN